jgi:hypothetical protein
MILIFLFDSIWLLILHYAVRLRDEVQCAAARVVHALRLYTQNQSANIETKSSNSSSIQNNEYYSLHVRRGDFTNFASTSNISATEIFRNIRDEIPDGSVLYISTDEKNKYFFSVLKEHYNIKFMDDFVTEVRASLSPVNTNFYGMIDQLVVCFLVVSLAFNCRSRALTFSLLLLRHREEKFSLDVGNPHFLALYTGYVDITQ